MDLGPLLPGAVVIADIIYLSSNLLGGMMRLISLNLWYGEKLEDVGKFITSHIEQTDIFCFQETQGTEAMLGRLIDAEKFSFREVKKSASEDYSLRTYIRNNIEIISVTELIKEPFEEGSALAMELVVGDVPLAVVNVHGVSQPGNKLDTPARIKQSESIIEFLKNKGDVPKIVCGDFNLMPSTESVEIFEKFGYRNLIKDHRIPTTRNELAWAKYPDNKQLFADYTFVSEDVKVNQFVVPNILISDHLPMILDFDLV